MEPFAGLEEFENESLPKILPTAFGKMGSKTTLDLPTLEDTKRYYEEMKNSSDNAKMLVHME